MEPHLVVENMLIVDVPGNNLAYLPLLFPSIRSKTFRFSKLNETKGEIITYNAQIKRLKIDF